MRTTTIATRHHRLAALAAAAALAVTGLVAAAAPSAATAPVHAKGDVILNMFQWTWKSVAAECPASIGPAGFGYVQVSPPQEHVTGSQWWTSYQPVSYKIESKLGTRAEFKAMVDSCASAGVGVIVDAVVNHTTGADRSSGTGVAGTPYGIDSAPGVPYGYDDFNTCRTDIANYSDRYQVQNCRLSSLQDLKTGSDYVRGKIAGYLNDLIGLGVSGFRIDAAKHIPAADLQAIKSRLSNPNIYWVEEVIGASGEPVQPSEYWGSGDTHEFNYARTLKSRFEGSIKDLRTISDGLIPSADAGVFVDNHDTERNGQTLTYKSGARYNLANTFMLAYPYGSPAVYTGYRFSNADAGAPGASDTHVPDANCSSADWTCVQRWTDVADMVKFHNTVAGTGVTDWTDDGSNLIGFGRGAKGYVTINNSGSPVTRTFTTSLPAGTYCNVIATADCSATVTVAGGSFTTTVPAYGAVALHVGATTTGGNDPGNGSTTTVFYSTAPGWSAYKIHYKVGTGAWTTAPGVDLTAACAGWVSRTITTGGATITAAFTNGSGTWDNNGSRDYSLSGANAAVSGGSVTATNPCNGPVASAGATFKVTASTVLGQNVYVVGDIAGLGSWNTSAAKPLSAATYPIWAATVDLPAGTTFQYKYIKKDGSGTVIWESGANRTGTVGTGGSVTFTDTWRS
jgi:alpha-amylase